MGRGVAPEKWGRSVWSLLHVLALAAGREPRLAPAVRAVLGAMRALLPCGKCRRSYAALPPPAGPLAAWVHATHNRVNAKLGKPELARGEGLDGLVAAMPARALAAFAARAAAASARYIRRCVDERLGEPATYGPELPEVRAAWATFAAAVPAVLLALVREKKRGGGEGKDAGRAPRARDGRGGGGGGRGARGARDARGLGRRAARR
jgi:hypothetical protein